MSEAEHAPGHPGISPRWTTSAKAGVGTALDRQSQLWFTLSHGIVNEVYYPRVDHACVRDLGLMVAGAGGFFSEEKRHARSQVSMAGAGIPLYRLDNQCDQGRYRIEKEIFAHPYRDALIQRTGFRPVVGALADYRVYALLAPHIGKRGGGNNAWVGDYKGAPMLFAERDGIALALACSAPWLNRSVGFVGASDGWQDVARHGRMTWAYRRAENGNVALTGEIDLAACAGHFTLALGFGLTPAEAGNRALATLQDDIDQLRDAYVGQWQAWQDALLPLEATAPVERDLFRISAAVLRVHEAKKFPGGIIASLSVPWGSSKGDDDLGGYHLVWPRDLVETAGGLLAARAHDDALRVLRFLQAAQEADGSWAQNMWLDCSPYWHGSQMDEAALPVLLVGLAQREGALGAQDLAHFWPMVRRAASFIVRDGPVTQQDRWEEDAGYSPFTLGAEISALVEAATLARIMRDEAAAAYLLETADAWNAGIERWTYVQGTDLATRVGVDGYYVRIAPPDAAQASSPAGGYVPIKNRPPGQDCRPAAQIVSPDALALVRFGLRAPDDPRIVNTVKVIDALLAVETPSGPSWHRYNGDGYGEHADGAPFDGTGVGRLWPLLTGERAHYELAAGRPAEARRLCRAMAAFANDGGLISEQVWDAPDIPERELRCGRPSGSAMPLVWAHAEYLKLRRSLAEDRVFDLPVNAARRYLAEAAGPPRSVWRFNQKLRSIPAGRTLRIETLQRAVVHWSSDGWRTAHDTETRDSTLGVCYVDLPSGSLPSHARIDFTFYWPLSNSWEGKDFALTVE